MKTIAEMIPEYETCLDAMRTRRADLLHRRELEPSFEARHKLSVRIIRLDAMIASTSAALDLMLHYGGDRHG